MTQVVYSPSRRALVHLLDSHSRGGIFRGEGGPTCNSCSSSLSSSRIMRGTPLKGRWAIWCSSGRSKFSKSATESTLSGQQFSGWWVAPCQSETLSWGPRAQTIFIIILIPFPTVLTSAMAVQKQQRIKLLCLSTNQGRISHYHSLVFKKSACSTYHFIICSKKVLILWALNPWKHVFLVFCISCEIIYWSTVVFSKKKDMCNYLICKLNQRCYFWTPFTIKNWKTNFGNSDLDMCCTFSPSNESLPVQEKQYLLPMIKSTVSRGIKPLEFQKTYLQSLAWQLPSTEDFSDEVSGEH